MRQNKRYFKIFSKTLANQLCREGFEVMATEINHLRPWMYVYLFEDSPALRARVALYSSDKGGDRNEK